MVPVQLRYTNVSSWRVASDAQAGGDDAQLVCEHQLCRWQWYCWMFYSAKHLFLSDTKCCVEASCSFCYLRDSSVYVHECCCVGVQRHLPTYMKRRKCQDGPETYMQQRWCLISVTE